MSDSLTSQASIAFAKFNQTGEPIAPELFEHLTPKQLERVNEMQRRKGFDQINSTSKANGKKLKKRQAEKEENPATDLLGPDGINCTEVGNAERFVRTYGKDLRWAAKTYYVWTSNPNRWTPNDNLAGQWAVQTTKDLGKLVIQAAKSGYNTKDIDKLVKFWASSESDQEARAILSIAPRLGIAIEPKDFDSNPMLLGVQNGVVDLRDGSHRPMERTDLITKLCNASYDATASCPVWDRFMQETCKGDRAFVRYLQQCAGFCLTGLVNEHLFFIVSGPAGTGKSTFQEALKHVWGDYCVGIDPNTLAAVRSESAKARPDLAKLQGVRMAFANESREGMRLDEGLLKSMTGGDTITARYLYKNEMDFPPSHKIWLRTNHPPMFDGGDTGMKRRVRLVPFEHVVGVGKDSHLLDKLKAEASGILSWAIAGLKDYRKNGLQEPAIIIERTKDYVDNLDNLGLFLEECTVRKINGEIASSDLYRAYSFWMSERGHKPVSMTRLAQELSARGFRKRISAGRKFWRDLELSGEGVHVLMLSPVVRLGAT
jgi:putative DNA primase/helicase